MSLRDDLDALHSALLLGMMVQLPVGTVVEARRPYALSNTRKGTVCMGQSGETMADIIGSNGHRRRCVAVDYGDLFAWTNVKRIERIVSLPEGEDVQTLLEAHYWLGGRTR